MLRATATLVPVSEYLSTGYRPDCDYLDGELEERNVGAKDHGNVQKRLLPYLGSRERQLGIFVFPLF